MTKKYQPHSTQNSSTASRSQLDYKSPVKVHKDSPGSPRVNEGASTHAKTNTRTMKKLKESPIGRYMLTINAHHETPTLLRVDPAVARSFATGKVIRKNHHDYNYFPDHDNKAREEMLQSAEEGGTNCLMIGLTYENCAELHELAQKSPEKAFQRLAELENEGCATEPASPSDTIRYALVCDPFRKHHLKYLIHRTAFL